MEKIYKLLHKHYDIDLLKSSKVKAKREIMEKTFKLYHIPYQEENELDYFNNEIIYQGIRNKQKIETAHFEGRVIMNDFYDTLDYEEKRRLMNYETSKAKASLPFIISEKKPIYIPFFDQRMNQIYDNEMVLFDIKKYSYYKENFKQIMIDFKSYGNQFYQLNFCSAKLIYTQDDKLALFNEINNCIYFVDNSKLVNHLTLIKPLESFVLKEICYTFFNETIQMMVELLIRFELIKEKDIKKVNKLLKKVGKK